jgi:hypothetical protein
LAKKENAPSNPPKVLLGTDGNDSIVGAGASETIIAGLGNDFIIGGASHDVFVFDAHRTDAHSGAIHVPWDATGGIAAETGAADQPPVLFAQTFNALGSQPEVLTLHLTAPPSDLDGLGGSFTFKLLITGADANGAPSGDTVLYTSQKVTIGPSAGNVPSPVSFDLSGLTLKQGQEYAWVIDSVSTRDGIPDLGVIPGFNIHDAYAGGKIYLGEPPLNAPALAGPWLELHGNGFDFAFDLNFKNPVSDGHDIITDFSLTKDVLEIQNASASEVLIRDVAQGTQILTPHDGSITLSDVHALATGTEVLASAGHFDWLHFV